MTTSPDFASVIFHDLNAVQHGMRQAHSILTRINLPRDRGIAETDPDLANAIASELSSFSAFLNYASFTRTLLQISVLKSQVRPLKATIVRLTSGLEEGIAIETSRWSQESASKWLTAALEAYARFEERVAKANENTALMHQHYCLMYAAAYKVAAGSLEDLKAQRDTYVLEPSKANLAAYLTTADPIEDLVAKLKIHAEHMELSLTAEGVTAFREELLEKLQVAELIGLAS